MTHRILIVDDDLHIREVIRVALKKAGMTVSEARDGKEALVRFPADRPDLVVLDIGLPGMDGWEVLDRIRRDPTTTDIPVVVLTAHAEEESRRRANEGGADAFVTKPFQPNDFRSTVLSLLE